MFKGFLLNSDGLAIEIDQFTIDKIDIKGQKYSPYDRYYQYDYYSSYGHYYPQFNLPPIYSGVIKFKTYIPFEYTAPEILYNIVAFDIGSDSRFLSWSLTDLDNYNQLQKIIISDARFVECNYDWRDGVDYTSCYYQAEKIQFISPLVVKIKCQSCWEKLMLI